MIFPTWEGRKEALHFEETFSNEIPFTQARKNKLPGLDDLWRFPLMSYQVMPPLSADDFAALRDDIAARGVLVPVEYDEDGNILDGHHRVLACEEIGISDWPRFVRKGLNEDEKRTHARQLNLARRHLSQADKRELISAQLVETPQKSNRQIADGLGVSHPTVASVRAVLEDSGDVERFTTSTDALGRQQPTRKPHVAHNAGENEWYTPKPYVDAARAVMGSIDLDPASSVAANKVIGAAIFFTSEDDGLKQNWPDGNIWMNPPYAQPLMGGFADKYALHMTRSNSSQGIVLVNNATETGWFQNLLSVSSAVCFPKSRVKFLDPDGVPGAPLQGQAILYSGDQPGVFSAGFSEFGEVLRHV